PLFSDRFSYLLIAETFAPVAECVIFCVAYPAGARVRDCGAIIVANLASFAAGELVFNPLFRCSSWTPSVGAGPRPHECGHYEQDHAWAMASFISRTARSMPTSTARLTMLWPMFSSSTPEMRATAWTLQ